MMLGDAVYACESFGNFTEINLNAGCPSNKAKKQGNCGYRERHQTSQR